MRTIEKVANVSPHLIFHVHSSSTLQGVCIDYKDDPMLDYEGHARATSRAATNPHEGSRSRTALPVEPFVMIQTFSTVSHRHKWLLRA